MKESYTLITGASSGLGLEMARLLAVEGRRLILLARRRERLEENARELRSLGAADVRAYEVDLGDRQALGDFIHALDQEGLAIDTLINNAGFGLHGLFHELDGDTQLQCIDVNIRALTELTHALIPGMRARRKGAILNVASVVAFRPGPHLAVYSASKAYVLSFSQALAEELRSDGIRVSCLCPGPTATEFAGVAGMDHLDIFKTGAADAVQVSREGLQALAEGREVCLPGSGGQGLASRLRRAPRALIRKIVAKLG